MSEEPKVLPAPSENTPKSASYGFIFLFILVVVLGAGAGFGGYWVWQQSQIYDTKLADATHSTGQQLGRLKDLENEIKALQGQLSEAQQLIAQTSQSVDSRIQALGNEFELIKGSSRKDWLLAEAEYLLRIANQRLMIERDVSSSQSLLQAADRVLTELADPALMPVRMKIAEDVFALKASLNSQVEHHAIALTALSNSVTTIQLRPVQRSTAYTDVEPDGQSLPENTLKRVLHKLKNAIARAVRIHRAEERFEAPPTPEYSAYLVQNMGLRIEQARLFLLRGQYEKYRTQLVSSDEWLEQHFPGNHSQVIAIKHQLRTLETSIPEDHGLDISSSLTLLQEIIERKYRNQELGKHVTAEEKVAETVQ